MIDVQLKGVSKVYEDHAPAVDNIDLAVEHGMLMTLLGPSGCGKTTTLKMISGFESITSGDVYVADERVNDIPAHRRDVTTVFQNYALFPHMSVYHNVAYGLARRRVPREEARQRVLRMLAVVGLGDFAARYPSALSGGQQQRVALARSLVLKPKVILLDEPLSNLDAKLRKRMEVEIRAILHENNATAIHVTHDQEEALTMSDRVAVMNQGRIEQEGPPSEIYRQPANRWVAEFIGISNVLALTDVRLNQRGCVSGRVAGRFGVTSRAPDDLTLDGPVWLMIRPEALRVDVGPEGDATTGNRLTGRVTSTLYLGRCTRLEVALAGTDASVTVDVVEGQDRFDVGDDIRLAWEADDAWVLAK